MARIVGVTDFISGHIQATQTRRVDTMLQQVNQTPTPVIYRNINVVDSTAEFGTRTIDDYVGPDSPVRYDEIKDQILYGLPTFDVDSSFDEESGVYTDMTGDATIPPGTITPHEGDMFIVPSVGRNFTMVVNEVTTKSILGRSHFYISFHATHYTRWELSDRQVVTHNTAIFTNIGKSDESVIIADDKLEVIKRYEDIYTKLNDMYLKKFHSRKSSMIGLTVTEKLSGQPVKFIDGYLMRFLESNRIIIMDSLLENSFCLDNNAIFNNSMDEFSYHSSVFRALELKDPKYLKMNEFISIRYMHSPMGVYRRIFEEEFTSSNAYVGMSDIDVEPPFYTSNPLARLIFLILYKSNILEIPVENDIDDDGEDNLVEDKTFDEIMQETFDVEYIERDIPIPNYSNEHYRLYKMIYDFIAKENIDITNDDITSLIYGNTFTDFEQYYLIPLVMYVITHKHATMTSTFI